MRAVCPQFGIKRGVIIEKAKMIIRQFAQRSSEPFDGLDILLVPTSVTLDWVGEAWIAKNDGYIGKERSAPAAACGAAPRTSETAGAPPSRGPGFEVNPA